MKSERRHDLETNELAIRMQEWIDRLKPYASQIAIVLVGVLLLAYIATSLGGANIQKEEEAWTEFMLASYSTDPELRGMKLLAENEEFSKTAVPEWAYLAWANRQVLLSSQSYLADRANSLKRLETVQQVFQNLADNASSPQVQDRARFALAQVLEMLGMVDDAKSAYERVKGDLSPLAEARVEELSEPESAQAVEWLATTELPMQTPASTAGALSGTKPDFEAEVPAALPSSNTLNTTRSMEDILSDALGPTTDQNRYDEATPEPSVPDSSAAESNETESDEPESKLAEAEEEDAAESVGDPEEESAPAEQ